MKGKGLFFVLLTILLLETTSCSSSDDFLTGFSNFNAYGSEYGIGLVNFKYTKEVESLDKNSNLRFKSSVTFIGKSDESDSSVCIYFSGNENSLMINQKNYYYEEDTLIKEISYDFKVIKNEYSKTYEIKEYNEEDVLINEDNCSGSISYCKVFVDPFLSFYLPEYQENIKQRKDGEFSSFDVEKRDETYLVKQSYQTNLSEAINQEVLFEASFNSIFELFYTQFEETIIYNNAQNDDVYEVTSRVKLEVCDDLDIFTLDEYEAKKDLENVRIKWL